MRCPSPARPAASGRRWQRERAAGYHAGEQAAIENIAELGLADVICLPVGSLCFDDALTEATADLDHEITRAERETFEDAAREGWQAQLEHERAHQR